MESGNYPVNPAVSLSVWGELKLLALNSVRLIGWGWCVCVCVRERDGWTDKLDSVLSPIQTRWDVQCNATGLNVKLKHLWGREHVIEELSQQACPSLSLLFFVFLFLTPIFFFIFARSLMWRKLIGGQSVQPTAVLEIFCFSLCCWVRLQC